MNTVTGAARVGEIEIAYAESGAGEPVILVHGGEGTRAQYDAFRALLGDGIRAIAYDQRDSGASTNPPQPYGMADLAEDCAALIRELGYERAHVFGTSYGGMLALQLAVSVPDVVQSLTVGAAFADSSAVRVPSAAEIIDMPPDQRDARMLAFVLSERGQRNERLVAQVRSTLVHRDPEVDARRIAAIDTYDVTEGLPGITAPTLLLYGEHDPAARPDVGRRIADAIPGARLEVIQGARHGFALEFAHDTAQLLREFVLAHPVTGGRRVVADGCREAVPSADVVGDYPADRNGAFDPPELLDRLRGSSGLHRVATPDGRTPWLVTRYDDVRAVLGDHRFSVQPDTPGIPTTSPALSARNTAQPTFLTLDDPEHSRLRRTVVGEFTHRRLSRLRPVVEQEVAHHLDTTAASMAASPDRTADLVAAFALPVASKVISQLLGVPYADHAFFEECTRLMVDRGSSIEQASAASQDLTDYLRRSVIARLDAPTDDLTGRLATRHVATGTITLDEACATLLILLVAGHETTAYATAMGVLRLLTDDDAAAWFRGTDEEHDDAVSRAVEELLRLDPPVHFGHARAALADVEVGDTIVRAGEGVYAVSAAANRDPRFFADPARFDPNRATVHRHLSFGHGVHQCVGQQLARMELQIAIPAVLRRFPGLRLAVPVEAVRFRDDMIVYGPHELPVRWSPQNPDISGGSRAR